MNLFKAIMGQDRVAQGGNLAVIAKGSSTPSASPANPDKGMAAMATQGLRPTALDTVSGGEVPKDGLRLERGWCVCESFPNASTNYW